MENPKACILVYWTLSAHKWLNYRDRGTTTISLPLIYVNRHRLWGLLVTNIHTYVGNISLQCFLTAQSTHYYDLNGVTIVTDTAYTETIIFPQPWHTAFIFISSSYFISVVSIIRALLFVPPDSGDCLQLRWIRCIKLCENIILFNSFIRPTLVLSVSNRQKPVFREIIILSSFMNLA